MREEREGGDRVREGRGGGQGEREEIKRELVMCNLL